MAMARLTELFEAARRVSVPIVVVRTADQAATVEALSRVSSEWVMWQWDAAEGMGGVAPSGLRDDKGTSLGAKELKKAQVTAENSAGWAHPSTSTG